MSYITYILESQKNNSYYIGQTNNLQKRLNRHNKGYNKSTKNGCPWKVIYQEYFNTRKEAAYREKEIKNKKSRKFIKKLNIYLDR